jgi:hypothetical protein
VESAATLFNKTEATYLGVAVEAEIDPRRDLRPFTGSSESLKD